MAYIYRKIISGKTYYYLRISKRINNKIVTKDIAYLGNEISKVLSKLDNLKDYELEIRKSYDKIRKYVEENILLSQVEVEENEYIKTKLLKEIETAKLHFKIKFLKLDDKTILDTYKNFIIDFAYNTTSIEGNTITLEEASKLLREKLTPKEKTLREVFDVQNTQKVFLDLLHKPKFDLNLIKKIHKGLMENVDVRVGFRTHNIRVFRSSFDASPAKYVETDMKLLMKWYKENQGLHPIILGTMFHHKFEKIHPFSDGNGRTGRMLLIYILIKKGYPPLIVQKKNRSEYLNGLNKADKINLTDIGHNYIPLINFVGEEFVSSYWNNFNI